MSERFARAAAETFMTVERLTTASLEERVRGVCSELAHLVALGTTFDGLPGEPGLGAPPLSEWPGFGSYEEYWRETDEGPVPLRASETLWFVLGALWAGLEAWQEGGEERAVAMWSQGWDRTWGPAALELIGALHPAVVGYREDARQSMKRGRAPVAAPSLLRAPKRTEGTPSIGLQVRSVQDLVLVLVVHPAGPAQGVLQVGDVVLSIDGRPASASERPRGLVVPGAIGEVHQYEVYRDGETLQVAIPSVDVETFV